MVNNRKNHTPLVDITAVIVGGINTSLSHAMPS
jgi:hypothetical protein